MNCAKESSNSYAIRKKELERLRQEEREKMKEKQREEILKQREREKAREAALQKIREQEEAELAQRQAEQEERLAMVERTRARQAERLKQIDEQVPTYSATSPVDDDEAMDEAEIAALTHVNTEEVEAEDETAAPGRQLAAEEGVVETEVADIRTGKAIGCRRRRCRNRSCR